MTRIECKEEACFLLCEGSRHVPARNSQQGASKMNIGLRLFVIKFHFTSHLLIRATMCIHVLPDVFFQSLICFHPCWHFAPFVLESQNSCKGRQFFKKSVSKSPTSSHQEAFASSISFLFLLSYTFNLSTFYLISDGEEHIAGKEWYFHGVIWCPFDVY